MNEAVIRRERILAIACAAVLVFVVSQTALMLANIPLYYQRVLSGMVPTVVVSGNVQISNSLVAQWAAVRSMSVGTYAAYTIVLNLVISVGFTGAAILVMLRARRYWFRWFTAVVLAFFPSGGLWQFAQAGQLAYDYLLTGSLLWPSYLLFLYLFPNGRAVPRWSRWLIGPILLVHFGLQASWVLASVWRTPIDIASLQSLFYLVLSAFPLILACQVFRYVRVSTPVEREQTKWFVAGFALYLVAQLLGTGAVLLTEAQSIGDDIASLAALLIPVTLVIAILRYRLWHIDVIIRRTLVYGVLTAMLVAIYIGSVVVLQRIVQPLTGSTQSPLVTVVSTLTIAALFQPLRQRIQQGIDRRFYRRRYNAQQTLQAFGTRLRDHTNVERLRDDVLLIVHETMQPTHASLWLREPETRR